MGGIGPMKNYQILGEELLDINNLEDKGKKELDKVKEEIIISDDYENITIPIQGTIMKNENIREIVSAYIAKLPSRQTEVLIGCEPKVKSKYKILQKLFIKIFGYKLVFDKREAKILEIKAEDCPKVGVDSNLSIEL